VFWRLQKARATKLVCGLGNPGPEYQRHRHNVGFQVVDLLAERAGVEIRQRKFEGRIGHGTLAGSRGVFLKPETFMNAAGSSVASALRFYKISSGNLLVIHDELDLPFGRLQLKAGGGSGGHNGLNSLIDSLGTDEFVRLRLGIGKPEGPNAKERTVDYVLSNFTAEEQRTLGELVGKAADAADLWVREGLASAMNRFNRRELG
jgi:PTH1 family peptidyl-tRNA hydrolase